MILIITSAIDPHADVVASRLRARGAVVLRFDHSDYPDRAAISTSIGSDGQRSLLALGDETIDLEQVTAIWHRRPEPPSPGAHHLDADVRSYASDECEAFLIDVWQSLDCFKLPGQRSVFRAAEAKWCQLRLATELGMEVPPTLITNSPGELRAFYREHGGRIISKLASGTFHRDPLSSHCARYTELVSHCDIQTAHAVRHAPMIFQGYVPKRVELRITIVGDQVFTAEIQSQITHHTRDDWRRHDVANTPIVSHELPPRHREQCLELVRRLGLHYGAVDMIVTPDGRYVFVEVNPNGQYLWIEDASGLPISDAICDLLLSESKRRPASRAA